MSILLSHTLPWSCVSHSRFLFVIGDIGTQLVTLANIYAPNSSQLSFLPSCLEELEEYVNGAWIVGGDFNVALD